MTPEKQAYENGVADGKSIVLDQVAPLLEVLDEIRACWEADVCFDSGDMELRIAGILSKFRYETGA